MSFYTVTTGNTILAADTNQFANVLNGTTNGQVSPTNAAGTVPLTSTFTSAPGADNDVFQALVTADSVGRLAGYIRGADGYGGIRAGAGGSYTASFYAQSGGWVIPQNLRINGITTLDNGSITTSGTGGLNAVSVTAATGVLSGRQLIATYASGSYYDGSAAFSGTSSGTYSHGLSVAPDFVGVTQKVAGSTTTVGVDTLGATTCHVNINGAFAFVAWAVLN